MRDMCDGPPGPPVIRKLDFSQFHPLDHTVWQCSGYPGGRRTHLKYRWEFQWYDRLRSWTWCRAGRHRWVTWYRNGKPLVIACGACDKEKA